MLEAAGEALVTLLQPYHFLMLAVGVTFGLMLGVLPGMGGLIGLSIILPFVWGMDPAAALAILTGTLAVTLTSDSITAILFSVPTGAVSAATTLDGYPMTKKGEAARAMGVAFFGSMLGGVFGALVLTAAIPVARIILTFVGSPELFMLSLWGVSMVGGLSGRKPLKGIIAGCLGLAIGMVGGAPGVFHMRYTFGWLYLFNGFPIIVVALGMFALPEMADLFIKGTRIADVPKLGKGLLEGYKDALRHWQVLVRASAIGALVGFLPGVGGSVASWMAYAQAVATSKDKSKFGKGDVRGVLAPESANNACTGGDLIPTLIFGVPGSASMAIFLAGMLVMGISPGPDMVGKNLNLTFVVIWSLALSNIMACAACSVMARPIARLSVSRVHYIVPFVVVAVIVAAYQSTRNWGDLFGLAGFGVLGWLMKRNGWPRPPLLVGFVLGNIMDTYLWISTLRYGAGWLLHPGVILVGIIIVVSLYFTLKWQARGEAVEKLGEDED